MIVFHGEGLYDDPDLGWEGLASSIDTIAVPGEHTSNRMMMAEPHVKHLCRAAAESPRRQAVGAPELGPRVRPGRS